MAARLARIASKADAALDGRYSETDSSEDEAMRAVPRGCLGKAGVALVAASRAGEDEYARPETARASVVDTNQFRNTQVGVGYQAPFVVRQPGAAPAAPAAPAVARAAAPAEPVVLKRPRKEKKAKKEKKSKKKHKKEKKSKKASKRKKDASSSSSDDDDDEAAADAAAASAAGAADVPPGDEMPRRLALFEALLLDRVAAVEKKSKRAAVLGKTARGLGGAGAALLDL